MADFFVRRGAGPGLALFLNAGDPPLDQLPDVLRMLDESGVDCLELAVPFPDSFTDGPVIRASAGRALARGADLDAVLTAVRGTRPRLRRLRIALLADWSHTVRPVGLPRFLGQVRDAGADGVLLHGMPAVLKGRYLDAATAAAMPVVTTCYASSLPEVQDDAAKLAGAYLYLVAHYGRSGTAAPQGFAHLNEVVRRLRPLANAPIAIGFGVKTRADIEAVGATGADAAIVGSAAVSAVERADAHGLDVVTELADLVATLRAPGEPQPATAAITKGTGQ
ncbi:tryptophan synthase, alpha chain [Actinokineospora alba]|uniref:Tryptophan synthase alpha chain n=1 Tax=Actinokineospora alba TaxID=504798 RepID=A0A1H0R6N3_9PSEU|nr:tryptophan synthase subunit alpha [Actinokineospora alba]TDP70225.1 tryptophan synthase alpha chain [Actinokineospora alba]SDI36430.1 tryptophan synthase, alpha chain [Actinokineospora alba]SDP25154.1 tryptophan synthase, alpha chain [Actinokineospora alba]